MSKFYEELKQINEGSTQRNLPYSESEVRLVDDHEEFANAMKSANDKRDFDSHQLYIISPAEAKEILDEGGKLFMTNDGKAGAYVKADGYMGGLFKDPTVNRKEAAKVLQKVRIEAGGYFFDAFATHLEDIYVDNGFRPLLRMDFDEKQAPDGWEETNLSTKPDIVFFVYDPSYDSKVGDGDRIEDFDEGYEKSKNYKR